MSPLATTLAIGAADLEASVPLWRRLEAEEDPPPFQTWAWARAWLRNLGAGAEPWLLQTGAPATGFLPLVLRRVHGLRVLSLIGHGSSDYLGPLGSAREPAALRAIGERLRREARHFDLIDLLSLQAGDEQRSALAQGLRGGARDRVYERCPTVRIEGRWEDYLATRSQRQRRHIKQFTRRLEDPSLAIARVPDGAGIFDELVDVERHSWKWEQGIASLRDAGRRAFLRELLADGELRHELWTARMQGELCAFALVLLAGRTRYYYLPSFRAEHPGVGNLLLVSLLRDSFAAGLAEFDFLQGDEGYKAKWANAERQAHQLVAAGGGLRGAGALAAVRGRWWLAGSPALHRLRARWLAGRTPAVSESSE